MKKIVKWIIGSSPYPELFIRRLYYSSTYFNKFKKIKVKKENQVTTNPFLFDQICKCINELGINKGDILIVHSSMDVLAPSGASTKQYIDMLLETVGECGTLVIPTFPLYNQRNEDLDVDIYNPRKTLCWTGMLPNIFLRYPDVVRSKFPVNSLAAKGPHALEMMRHNLESDLAHGKNSSWEYCINHHAKILFLGVDPSHSSTIVHTLEDLLDSEWPIKNWYEYKKYLVIDNNEEKLVTARIRRQYWSRYVTSFYRSHISKKNGYLKETSIDGITIGYISDSKQYIDFLNDQLNKGRLFFKVPKKYLKRG